MQNVEPKYKATTKHNIDGENEKLVAFNIPQNSKISERKLLI